MSETAKRMMLLSNVKLNAANLTPEHSLALPLRQADADEQFILDALKELYSSTNVTDDTLSIFAAQAVFTHSDGQVSVGAGAIAKYFAKSKEARPTLTLEQQSLLQSPESLPARTMCVDQTVSLQAASFDSGSVRSVRSLVVLKRRNTDGKIVSLTEEEGHRKATAPLATRAAGANSFYSPTDNMVSPCTSKLNLAKKKHHLKGKPTTLFASSLASKAPNRHLSSDSSSQLANTEMDF